MTFMKIFGLLICFFYLTISPSIAADIEKLVIEIVSVLPHDPEAFTQGLAISGDYLYESTGLYGKSSIRKIDLKTGKILQKKNLSPFLFGEGIALLGDMLIQLTWKEKKAWVYDKENFFLIRDCGYEGEGWGLCFDGELFLMSDGSDKLALRDPKTFSKIASFYVTMNGEPCQHLNDLENVGEFIYANVWKSNQILRISKITGQVTGLIDTSSLLSEEEKKLLTEEDVVNGIAYHPNRKTFFITGKRWPWMFEVRFYNIKH